jgi:hypothetical protein
MDSMELSWLMDRQVVEKLTQSLDLDLPLIIYIAKEVLKKFISRVV